MGNNVPVIESEIVSDNTSQNELSASLPENEAKMKKKKRKSIKSSEEQVGIDKARENDKNQTITTNITATEPTSMDVIDHKEVTQKESSSNSVINSENVNSKNTDIFEMVVADISLDVTHDELKSSLETAMTETNSDYNVENIDAELASEIRNSECVKDVPIIESGNSGQNELSSPSPKNGPNMKRKKRRSIKSKEEQIYIDKARENNMDSTTTANVTATEPTSIDVIDHKELTKKERSNEIVINAKNVNSKKNDMFEMAEADNSLDAPHDEIKSSIDTTISETNSNSIVENINTELAPEIRTIDTECVNEDPISDAVVNMGKA